MILVTGGTGFVGGHVVRALRDAGRRVRVPRPRPGAAGELEALGCELVEGDMTERRDAAGARSTASRLRRPSRRDPAGQGRAVRAHHEPRARATSSTRRASAGVGRFVHMSALGTNERDEGPRPLLPREVGDGAGRGGLRAPVRDLPAELRLRRRRRHPPHLPQDREAGAGDPDHRLGRAADPADLGRRRRRLLRPRGRRSRRRRTARSSSAARTSSTGTSSGRGSSARSA